MPALWPATARTSHRVQSVGLVQSSGASERRWSANLAYSVRASSSTSPLAMGGIDSTFVAVIISVVSFLGASWPFGYVLVEHLDGLVDQPDPAVSARIVGQLLVRQTGADGREEGSSIRGSVTPERPRRAASSARLSWEILNDSGEGSKPGIVRWNSSW
jgi:hypothetical protein